MAKWITRLPPKEKIAGSIPAGDEFHFFGTESFVGTSLWSSRGEMDTASPSGGEDSGFESRRGLSFFSASE